jgi:hypothetical protein
LSIFCICAKNVVDARILAAAWLPLLFALLRAPPMAPAAVPEADVSADDTELDFELEQAAVAAAIINTATVTEIRWTTILIPPDKFKT